MTEEKCAYIYSEKLSCELDKILKIRGRVSRKLFFNFSLTVKFMILSRYHFQIIVTHRYTPVPRRPHRPSSFPAVISRTTRDGEGRWGRECRDGELLVTQAKTGNGSVTVMG